MNDGRGGRLYTYFLNPRRFGDDLEAGRIRPVIHAVLPLEKAMDAHQMMESSEHFGKIVLRV